MKRFIKIVVIAVFFFMIGLLIGHYRFSPNIAIFNEQLKNEDKKDNEILGRTLRGRYLIKGTDCAGFEFLSENEVIWRNESACFVPDTLGLFWLENDSFLVKDLNRKKGNPDCPPVVRYFRVSQMEGPNLNLTEIWTGWGEFEADTLKLVKR
jgi:hypothetical protein